MHTHVKLVIVTVYITGSRGSYASTPAKPLLTPSSESEGRSFDTTEMSVEYFFASDARYVERVKLGIVYL